MVEQSSCKKIDFTKIQILMSLLLMYLNYKDPQIFHDYMEVVSIEPLVEEINVRAKELGKRGQTGRYRPPWVSQAQKYHHCVVRKQIQLKYKSNSICIMQFNWLYPFYIYILVNTVYQ